MSIANDNLYRYLVEESGTIIGAIDTTAEILVGQNISINNATKTVSSIKTSTPKMTTETISYNTGTHKKVRILMDRNVLVDHGYRNYTHTKNTQSEDYNSEKRIQVLVVD